jgi:hypothetical protein
MKMLTTGAVARLLAPESKLGPDRRDSVAVQQLSSTSKNYRFLDVDMVGVKLLESLSLGTQLKCIC